MLKIIQATQPEHQPAHIRKSYFIDLYIHIVKSIQTNHLENDPKQASIIQELCNRLQLYFRLYLRSLQI